MPIRKRVYEILEVANPGDRVSRAVDFFILGLILLNVLALVLESVDSYKLRFDAVFTQFEFISLAVFSAEYLLRLWSAVEDPAYSRPIGGRLRFALTPQALVDLAAVAPFYLGLYFGKSYDARFVRVLRLLKLAR